MKIEINKDNPFLHPITGRIIPTGHPYVPWENIIGESSDEGVKKVLDEEEQKEEIAPTKPKRSSNKKEVDKDEGKSDSTNQEGNKG